MATLADELLADLMEDGSDGEEGFDDFLAGDADGDATISAGLSGAMDTDQDQDQYDEAMSEAAMLSAAAAGRSAVTEAEDEDEAKARVAKMHFGGISDVRSVAGLIKSLKPVLEKINHYQTLPPEEQTTNAGSVEDNPEYRLLVEANELSSRIDNEIILVHKFIRDHYSIRFPELESLVQNPLLYAKTVAIIGNGPMDNMDKMATSSDNVVGQSLKQVLDGPSLMVVRLEGTKTAGREMTESELVTVQQACDMTLQLDNAKKILTDYVQSRMNLFAPNLTVLIGSETAAQLVNSAGGLTGLAKVPACNIAAMGSKKQTFGLATNTRVRRQGFLFHSALVQGIPPDLRNQAMRIISAKLVLAARVDRIHSSPDGSTGAQLKQDCEDRLEKLTAPPPNKGPRALPAPDDKPSRKRGGRRARKAKEQYAMTDLRKAQNRMAFGKEELEVGDGDETEGLGMIGQGAKDGQIRATKIDQRTKARLSKKNAGWAGGAATAGGLASSLRGFGQGGGASMVQGLRAAGVGGGGGGGGGTGTASVIAFTPFQGLELVNPKVKAEMERKRNAEENRWFQSGTFTQVGGGAAMPPPDVKVDSAGFKVPALPALKRLKTEK